MKMFIESEREATARIHGEAQWSIQLKAGILEQARHVDGRDGEASAPERTNIGFWVVT